MKILITGSDGMLGRDLIAAMGRDPEVMGITRNSIDLTDAERVRELITKYKPAAIIHGDAMSDLDMCETQPWEALRINVLTTQNLVLSCLETDAGLALISTNHVFNGTKKGPYTEWDVHDPQNVFGHSKSAAEMVVRNHLKRFHIIRTQGLYSSRGDNFVLRCLKSVMNNEPINASSDEFTLPTWTRDFSEAVSLIVRKRLYGTYHITNAGERNGITWADWADVIMRVGGSPDHPINAMPGQALGRPARRPARAVLGNTFYRLQGFNMRGYEEALRAFFDSLAGGDSRNEKAGRVRKPGLVYGDEAKSRG